MSDRPTDVVRDVVVEVNGRFGLSTAQRAELCASRLLETGDEAAILLVLKSGFQRELSRDLSNRKTMARVARSSFAPGATDGQHAEQLVFPVVVPGMPAVPLFQATNRIIRLALDAEVAQLDGRRRNVDALQRYAIATEPWPDRTVGDLIAAGLIGVGQIEGRRQAA